MLSTVDADLVRRDPALPGLATLLDPDALLEALRTSAGCQDLQSVQISYVKYKPGANCLVGLWLQFAGTAVEGYATCYPPDARDNERHVREQPGVPSPLGPGRVVLPNATVVSVFPNDSEVKSLVRLSDQRRCEFLRKRFPFRPDLWDASLQRLAYKPERRYVGKLSTNERPLAVLKAYTPEGFAAAEATAKALQSLGALKRASLIGGARGVLIWEWLPGRPLSDALLDEVVDPRVIELVGAILAELHGQESDGFSCDSRAVRAAELLHEANSLGRLYPRVSERVEKLARRLADRLGQHNAEFCLIHGDFHARQVLLVPDGVALVDFDRAIRADPAADLGLFIAHLERETVRGNLTPDRVAAVKDALLGGYWRASRESFPGRVDLYTAMEMLRLAPRFFRYWEPDWPERVESLLARAETLMHRTELVEV